MISIPNSESITLISKQSLSGKVHNIKVLNRSEILNYISDFNFATKRLFVDCDEDCFLEIDPNPKQSPDPILLLWKNLNLQVSNSIFKDIMNGFPLLCPFLAEDLDGNDLMLAWGKKESLVSAMESGFGTYFSRSRNGKWVKGEESGHLQNIEEIHICLDPFYVLYKTKQIGAACHTGYYSCFFREMLSLESVSFVFKSKVGE
ncbi:phosphoribosyl-AMP cyclohydrolase [Leptospira sp. 96542]|nr:phosphoribosyl-AMP cyclohydrolase [Leptospira sp. 96542]